MTNDSENVCTCTVSLALRKIIIHCITRWSDVEQVDQSNWIDLRGTRWKTNDFVLIDSPGELFWRTIKIQMKWHTIVFSVYERWIINSWSIWSFKLFIMHFINFLPINSSNCRSLPTVITIYKLRSCDMNRIIFNLKRQSFRIDLNLPGGFKCPQFEIKFTRHIDFPCSRSSLSNFQWLVTVVLTTCWWHTKNQLIFKAARAWQLPWFIVIEESAVDF